MKKVDLQTILSTYEAAEPLAKGKTSSYYRKQFRLSKGGLNAKAIGDAVPQEGLVFLSIAIPVRGADAVQILAPSYERENHRDHGSLLKARGRNPALWFPGSPRLFVFDEISRIRGERACQGTWLGDGRGLECRDLSEGLLVISFVLAMTDVGKRSMEEVFRFKGSKIPIDVEGEGGGIQDPSEFWKFYILGNIYNPKPGHFGRNLSTQTAYGLFRAFLALEHFNGLRIWKALRRIMVLTAVSSLDEQGLWRHGEWLEKPETHTRLQIDGVNLLLEDYRELGEEASLRTAEKALSGLLTLTEDLGSHGLWFLHDSYEKDGRPVISIYLQTKGIKLFGKSPNNTLCLNTHVYALVALKRFLQYRKTPFFLRAYDHGVIALKAILGLRPSRFVHGLMGCMIEWALANGRNFPLHQRVLNRVSRDWTQRNLHSLNRIVPCLIMPSGHILRDLELPFYSIWYHLVNMYDLMLFWLVHPLPEVRETLVKGWNYCVRGNLIAFLKIHRHSSLPQLAEVYVLAAKCGLVSDPTAIADPLRMLREKKIPFTPGVYGCNPLSGNVPREISQNPDTLTVEVSGKTYLVDLTGSPTPSVQPPR